MAFAKAQPPRTSLRYHADGSPLSPVRSSALLSPAPAHPGVQYSPRTGRKLPPAPGSGLFMYGSPRSRRREASPAAGAASSPLHRPTGAARAGISFAAHGTGRSHTARSDADPPKTGGYGGYEAGRTGSGGGTGPLLGGEGNMFTSGLAGIGRSLSGSESALSLMLERALIKIAKLESQVGRWRGRPRVADAHCPGGGAQWTPCS